MIPVFCFYCIVKQKVIKYKRWKDNKNVLIIRTILKYNIKQKEGNKK